MKEVSKDTRPAENNPIFLKAVRLHGRPPARPLGFEKTRLFFRDGVFREFWHCTRISIGLKLIRFF
jgi:hypothetical protein